METKLQRLSTQIQKLKDEPPQPVTTRLYTSNIIKNAADIISSCTTILSKKN